MRRRNTANPTMKKSRKVESEVDARNLALIQELKELEYIWISQEKSRPRRPRSSSTASFDNLFQNSPRRLMCSLQHKNCSNAVEEILMDRRAAIISGRFKGRQLFATAAEESEICSDDWIQERQVTVNCDGGGERRRGSSESCSFPVVEVAHGRRRKEMGGGRSRVATATLGLVLIVLALVLFCMSCNGNNVEDVILVPT